MGASELGTIFSWVAGSFLPRSEEVRNDATRNEEVHRGMVVSGGCPFVESKRVLGKCLIFAWEVLSKCWVFVGLRKECRK